MKTRDSRLDLRHLLLYAMLGAIMAASKWMMEGLPNVHLLGVFTMAYTLAFRRHALIPVYVFVFLVGLLIAGFSPWWIPYLYLWAILWGVTMLLPKNMKPAVAVPVYMTVCGLFGLSYGTLYAPFQALFYGLNWKGMLAWIGNGIPWDIVHGVSNFCWGVLVFPLAKLLTELERRYLSQ